jgi:hypothetical protein
MSIRITIPSVNGGLEFGIAVGVDQSLADAQKLHLLENGPLVDVREQAVLWAFRSTASQPTDIRKLLVNAAVVAVNLQLCRLVGERHDGDWIYAVSEAGATPEEAATISSWLSMESIIRAGTLMIATKANWWATNHHTGGDGRNAQGYVAKVLALQYQNSVSAELVSAVHTIGHWISTLYVLDTAGVKGLLKTDPATPDTGNFLMFAADSKLRFSALPAGTHRLGLSYEAARRLFMNRFAKVCPNVIDMATIPDSYVSIRANMPAYHIGASYLTGRPRADYSDSRWDFVMGRLGLFINTLYPKSTLAKSPHFDTARVQTYEDYSEEWRQTLLSSQLSSREAAMEIAKQLPMSGLADDGALESIRKNFDAIAEKNLPPARAAEVPAVAGPSGF